jgi:poly-gamma-glutamate synthesis protein (capsule biosynthesis protein)
MKTLILGDVSPTKDTAELFRKKDINTLFNDVLPVMKDSEFTFVNLECALTESDGKIRKFGPHLKAPTETAEVLKEVGVTVCGLSNNHIFDYGVQGAKDTIKALGAAGVDYTGFGKNYEDARKNYFFEKDGEKICVIAVCEHEFSGALENRMGSRTFEEFDTMEDIRKARTEADRVIVCYHGGKEYCKYPSPRLRKVCQAMARCGADVVLCQHSHCIGCYEEYQGCHIVYGQGNFHFVKDTISRVIWYTALAVEYDTKSHEISFIPLRTLTHGITVAKGEDADDIMTQFKKRSEQLKTNEWKEGWHEFCLQSKEDYISGIAKVGLPTSTEMNNALLAQFLCCEAHNDVCRELYPPLNDTNCIGEE